MPASFTYIIIIAAVLYIIVSQFIEQPVKPLMLLGLPVAVAYISYITFEKNLAEAFVNPGLLIADLVIGLLPGLCLGVFRGTLVRVRRDASSGITFVKPSRLSIVIWITLLVLRIAAMAVTYSGLGHGLAPVILATTAMSALFLGSVVAEKASIFCQWMQIDTQNLLPFSSRMVK
jgi:magnesium-transporting ATPase (P-type)